MKYLYLLLILLSLFSIYNYVNLNSANEKIKEFSTVFQNLQRDSNNYLYSLTKEAIDYDNIRFLLNTGDTLSQNLTEMPTPSLNYFFSSQDCMSCVEENIFSLIKLAKKNNSISINILTTNENRRYLELIKRSNNIKNINYGFCTEKLNFSWQHYFIIYKNGVFSNIYYPQKGNFESMKRYLENVISFVFLPDSINEAVP